MCVCVCVRAGEISDDVCPNFLQISKKPFACLWKFC